MDFKTTVHSSSVVGLALKRKERECNLTMQNKFDKIDKDETTKQL